MAQTAKHVRLTHLGNLLPLRQPDDIPGHGFTIIHHRSFGIKLKAHCRRERRLLRPRLDVLRRDHHVVDLSATGVNSVLRMEREGIGLTNWLLPVNELILRFLASRARVIIHSTVY